MTAYLHSVKPAASAQTCARRILITNDDGIDAPGLRYLTELAQVLGDEVWVVAPEQDQSGASQSISLHQPLRVQQRSERCFVVRGTPADCVLMGVFELLPGKPDLVLSGINRGINIADAVGFSGTLGAARTAALFDIPAIALSQAWKDPECIHWHTAASHAGDLIRNLVAGDWPAGMVANINFPAVAASEVRGVINTTMNGQSLVQAQVECRQDSRRRDYYWLAFEHRYQDVKTPLSDVNALRERAIALSFEQRRLTEGLHFGLFSRVASSLHSVAD